MPLTPAQRLEIVHDVDRDARARREIVTFTRVEIEQAIDEIEAWYERGGVQAAVGNRLPGRLRAQSVTLMRAVARRST